MAASGVTVNFSLSYPEPSDIITLAQDIQNLADDVDSVLSGEFLRLEGGTLTGSLSGTSISLSSTISASGLSGALLSTATPIVNGVAAVGTSAIPSRQDHVHPTDTSRLASSAYTAADVLSKLLTVDGTGSGLDADLLDGQSSAAFATAAHNHTGTYQPLDGDLTAIAALAGTEGILRKTAANTWTLDTSTYTGGNETITLSGDATGSGTTAITVALANTSVSAGTYGSATQVPAITVDAKGRATGVTNTTIAIPESAVTNLVTDLSNKQNADADLTAIAGLSGTSGYLKKTAANTWTLDIGTTSGSHVIYIEDFAGANDQEKLNNALIYAAAQTYRPAIQFLSKSYTFSPIHTFDGLRLIGAPGGSSQADRAGTPGGASTRISCTGSGAWLIPTEGSVSGRVYDVSVQGIAFTGNSNLAWLADPTVSLWYCNFRDLTFSSFKTVLGTQANKLLITGCVFDGFWQINNSYDGAITVGGSDCIMFSDGIMLDSAPAYVGSNQYHFRAQYLAKSSIGGAGVVYITCAGDWGGLQITGNNTDGPLFVSNIVAEGRNAATPAQVGCIRQDSGWTYIDNVWASFSQAYPIQMNGGLMVIDQGAYAPCNTSPSDRWIDHAGGTLHVSKCFAHNITKPVVNSHGGTIVADSTVTVV